MSNVKPAGRAHGRHASALLCAAIALQGCGGNQAPSPVGHGVGGTADSGSSTTADSGNGGSLVGTGGHSNNIDASAGGAAGLGGASGDANDTSTGTAGDGAVRDGTNSSTPSDALADAPDIVVNPMDAVVCAAGSGVRAVPPTLVFMVDTSGSMTIIDPGQTMTRWQIVSAAISQFATAPENAGAFVGLEFFPNPFDIPNNADCSPASYGTLNVPIAALPGDNNAQAQALVDAVAGRLIANSNTPTTPALQGGIVAATNWQTAHPEQQVYLVLVTDGQPNGCSSTVTNAAAAVMAGATAVPSIKTYVVGVGPDVGSLDSIAVAGRVSPTATIVTSGGAGALADALSPVKYLPPACEFVSSDPGRDPNAINVQIRVGASGFPTLVANVADASACGTGAGWYLKSPPIVGAPIDIALCPATCGALRNNPGSNLQILIACATRP